MKYVALCTLAGLSMLLSAACSKDENESKTSTTTSAPATAAPSAAPAAAQPASPQAASAPASVSAAPADNAETIEVAIASVGDTMAFDKTKLTVPSGANVHLVFKNNGTQQAMTHNWVLVKVGTEAAVAAAGLEKGAAAGYFAQTGDVLAATPLAAPKATAEVTFKAPAPGKYPYICTFPGHYMMMKGELTVTP